MAVKIWTFLKSNAKKVVLWFGMTLPPLGMGSENATVYLRLKHRFTWMICQRGLQKELKVTFEVCFWKVPQIVKASFPLGDEWVVSDD